MAGNRALAAGCWRVLSTIAAIVCASAAIANPAAKQPQQLGAAPAAMSKDAPSTPSQEPPASAKPSDAKLEPITFADLPGWDSDDHLTALQTFLKSCDAVAKAPQPRPCSMRRPARRGMLCARW